MQAAVTVVTSGLLINFLGLNISQDVVCFILLLCLSTVLAKGKMSYLDAAIKPIVLILVLCTVLAFSTAFKQTTVNTNLFLSTFNWMEEADLIFLAALVGWMPSPLDGSVWHSVWAADANKESGKRVDLKDTLFDLRFSYLLIIVLALIFMSLGAIVMHTRGLKFSQVLLLFPLSLWVFTEQA